MFLFLYGCAEEGEPTLEAGGVSVVSLYVGLSGATDAIPSPDAETLWFTVAEGEPGLWTAPFDGSGTPASVATLDAPQGVVTDDEGTTLYVADVDGVLAISSAGGTPEAVAGTAEHEPLALDQGSEGITYTGTSDGVPGVFRVAAAGGEPETLARGTPLVEPTGVVSDDAGRVWVCDEAAGADGRGALLDIAGGEATIVAEGFEAGVPCGVALTPDDATVMVSAVDDTGHSMVLLVAADSGEVSVFDDVIGENTGSGGLHRQEGVRTSPTHYAWIDRTNGSGRQIYDVTFE